MKVFVIGKQFHQQQPKRNKMKSTSLKQRAPIASKTTTGADGWLQSKRVRARITNAYSSAIEDD